MKENKKYPYKAGRKILIALILGIFLISLTSAGLLQSNLEYQNPNQTESYGQYHLHENGFLGLLRGDTIQTFKLLDSDNSVINAWATLEVTNYKDENLLDELTFNGGNVRDLKLSYLVNESYEVPTYNQVCLNETTNGTIQTNCNQVQNGTEIKQRQVWKSYNQEVLPVGNYTLKIEGKLPKVNHAVDWILNKDGESLDNWEWWNSSWNYKKQITLTANVGQFSYLATIPYNSHMNSDFSDLRFVDSAETIELNYTIESYTASTSAIVRVYSQGATSFYMYYGNSGATTTSSASDTYFNPVSYYYLDGNINDAVGSNDGTNYGQTLTTGKIDKGYQESSTSNYVSLISQSNIPTGDLSISLWIKPLSGGSSQILGSVYDPSGGKDGVLLTGQSGQHLTWYAYKENHVGTTTVGTTNLVANTWYHVVLTYKSSNTHAEIYLNGNLEASSNWGLYGLFHDTSLNLFKAIQLQSNNFNGVIDEVGIYNKVLTSTQAQKLFQETAPTFTVGTEQLNKQLLVSLTSPANNTNFSTNNINFVANVTPISLGITNVSLLINGNITQTDTSGNSGIYTFPETLTDGDYNWSVIAYGNNNIQYNATNGTLDFIVDTTPPTINVTSPSGTFNYLTSNDNYTLNFTVSDNHLNKVWYEYNETNTTVSVTNGTLKTIILNAIPTKSLTVYANDTSGNLNSVTQNWDYNLFDFLNYTYDTSITESSLTTFKGKFQTGSPISSSYLQYNNQNYSTSINSLGGNKYVLSSTVTTPTITSDTNVNWFFWVNGVNATSQSQTVKNINLDDCSSYAYKLINYTLVDEDSQELINNSNSTIESTVLLKTLTGGTVASLYSTFKGKNNPQVCSQENLTGKGLRLWEQTRYGSDNYVFKAHNIQNASVSEKIDIPLYDLLSKESTTFRIVYKDTQYLPVAKAIINIQRKYVGEGIYKSVESPITDANGEASGSFNLNAVLYQITVSQDGETIATFPNPAIVCSNILTGDCVINLNERKSPEVINNIDTKNDFTYSLTRENRTLTLNYNVPSGVAKTVTFLVNQTSILGNKTSCNQTVLSSSGSVSCVVSDTLGDVFINLYVYSNGELIGTGSVQILEDRSTYFGTNNIVLTFLLVLSLVLLMLSDPIAVLFGVIIGLLGSGLMLLTNSGGLFGAGSVLLYLVLVAILLIVKISGRKP